MADAEFAIDVSVVKVKGVNLGRTTGLRLQITEFAFRNCGQCRIKDHTRVKKRYTRNRWTKPRTSKQSLG